MVSSLTDEQLEELKSAYDMFDKDGDGISKDELRDAMNTFGKAPSADELDEIMRRADEDGSGTIDFEEFLKLMAGNLEESAQGDELKEAFTVFDRDGDGTISAKELKFIMMNLGEKLNEEELNHMMSIVDVDGDGEISYDEFSSMMMSVIGRKKK